MKRSFTICLSNILLISSSLIFLKSNIINAQTVTGKLVDQNGNGLSNLQLQLYISPRMYNATSSSDGSFTFSNITDVKEEQLPTGYAVSENFPNPFNPKTRIGITLPNSGSIRVSIYNLLGQKVRDEIEKYFNNAGTSFIDLELNGLPNGIYLARITLDEKYVITKKLMLMYGSQHLNSASGFSNFQLNKSSFGVNSILDTKIDSLVVTGSSIIKKIFTGLPDMVGNFLNLSNLIINVSPPEAPTLVSPANSSIDQSVSPTFSWNSSTTSTSYTIQVSTNNIFSSIVYEGSGLSATSQMITGLDKTTTYYWRMNATNNYGISAYSTVWSFTTISTCGSVTSVTYYGKTYNTISIKNQCWLKENLDVGTMIPRDQMQTNTGLIEKYCFDNILENCATYGGLYQWDEAMQYVTTNGAKGICPIGWHIPTQTDFERLVWAVNNDGNALKAIGQGKGSGAGTNNSGFSAMLAGYCAYPYYFYGDIAYFWGSTVSIPSASSTRMNLFIDRNEIYLYPDYLSNGFSVRCIKD